MRIIQIIMYEMFSNLPPYIWEGLIAIVVTIVGGIIVGLFASNIMEKKNEVIRVEGLMIEKKLAVYEEIVKRIQMINTLVLIYSEQSEQISALLHEAGLEIDTKKKDYNQVATVFTDAEKLSSSFLGFDQFVAQKRMYYDEEVYLATLVFQNYYSLFNRMIVMFNEQMIDCGVDVNSQPSKNAVNMMLEGLGMFLKDEFYGQSTKLESAIRNSINSISMKHRELPDYSYDFFMKEDGYIPQKLKDTLVIKKKEEIRTFVTNCIALGLVANGVVPPRK
jgi:hypothetical protein